MDACSSAKVCWYLSCPVSSADGSSTGWWYGLWLHWGGGGGGGREGDCCCKSQILVLKMHLAQPRGGDNSFCPGEQSALTVLGCSGGSLTPREGAGLYCTTWRSLILARIPVAPVQKQEASTGHSCSQVVQRSHFWQNFSVATFVPITLYSLSFLRCWYLPVTL